ncbi:MAG: tetratricopeptide repeat protein, partial [Acidobacteria bacterium]|nr:tetratricopeptide repeat protein [Acidobacteriota bacterium]
MSRPVPPPPRFVPAAPPQQSGATPPAQRAPVEPATPAPPQSPSPRQVATPAPSTVVTRPSIVGAGENDYFRLALYYQQSGDFENALVQYKKVLERNEMNAEAHNNLGVL